MASGSSADETRTILGHPGGRRSPRTTERTTWCSASGWRGCLSTGPRSLRSWTAVAGWSSSVAPAAAGHLRYDGPDGGSRDPQRRRRPSASTTRLSLPARARSLPVSTATPTATPRTWRTRRRLSARLRLAPGGRSRGPAQGLAHRGRGRRAPPWVASVVENAAAGQVLDEGTEVLARRPRGRCDHRPAPRCRSDAVRSSRSPGLTGRGSRARRQRQQRQRLPGPQQRHTNNEYQPTMRASCSTTPSPTPGGRHQPLPPAGPRRRPRRHHHAALLLHQRPARLALRPRLRRGSGNFQVNNFGRGGTAGDASRRRPRTAAHRLPRRQPTQRPGPGRPVLNNANFGTTATAPRRACRCNGIPDRPYRDGTMDGDVIAHEYGHGVSNRLVQAGSAADRPGRLARRGLERHDLVPALGDATSRDYVTDNTGGGTYRGLRRAPRHLRRLQHGSARRTATARSGPRRCTTSGSSL